jgi:hypothetical protein
MPKKSMNSSRHVPRSTSIERADPAVMASIGRCGSTSPPNIGCQAIDDAPASPKRATSRDVITSSPSSCWAANSRSSGNADHAA